MAKKKNAAAPKKAAEQAVKSGENQEFNKETFYLIEDAIKISKKMAKAKFDETIEVHFRLGIDPRKGDQQIRTAVSLPHGTGKTVKVAAFVSKDKEKEVKEAGADLVGGEDLIAEIKSTEKTDFDVAVAEPAMMKNLAQIAKILGTRGLMPSPKNETVTPNPAKAVGELKKGKVSFKNDSTANVHVAIGKVSFEDSKLVDNFNTILQTIKKIKPSSSKGIYIKNVSISSTMGPGIKLQVAK
jgi:large subunit ribosomal protein L1